jgi:hypothetical protein
MMLFFQSLSHLTSAFRPLTASLAYTIQASVAGRGGTASNGNVYLPNWN